MLVNIPDMGHCICKLAQTTRCCCQCKLLTFAFRRSQVMHVDPTAPLDRRLVGSFTAKVNREMWKCGV